MINPKNKLFRWGPIDGRPIYPNYWYYGFAYFNQSFTAGGWPEILMYFKKEKFVIIVDYYKLYNNGESIFKKHILDKKELDKNYAIWNDLLARFDDFYNKLEKIKINKKNIAVLLHEWNEIYGKEFWDIGALPEIANWGGEQMLERELKKRIKSENDFNLVFEKLTAPENFSFYQQEELDLLKLKKFKGKKLEQGLICHRQKYFWLLNNYHNSWRLPINYFKKRLAKETMVSAQKKINKMKKHKRHAIDNKMKIIKKYSLSEEILKISRRLSFSIWWQDFRKSYIFKANYIIDFFIKKMKKYFLVVNDHLHYYTVLELENLVFKNLMVSSKEIKLRKSDFLGFWDGRRIKYFSGKNAEKIIKPFLVKKVNKNIKEIKGMVVNRGRISGRVRILFSAKQADKFKKGDILVAPMTSPEYIVALKKAAAVITDEGGMTCHAAIVARELKIPGIVGTKIATKVLKDGDLVEVDANQGIVRKIY